MNKFLKLSAPILILLLVVGCGGREYKKSPVDEYIIKLADQENFTIILNDMGVDGTFFKTYKHKYQVVLQESDGTPVSTSGPWVEVSKGYFWANENNLGMTLCYKHDGKVEKQVSPPGYQYVGNSKYGEWRSQGSGGSFWAFYGQYMFMSHMFGMMNRPVYRSHYNTYRGGYYGSRGYYGPTANGKSMYGTNSPGTRKARPNFFQRRSSRSGWGSSRGRSGFGGRSSGFGK